jgi:hypothetical protein
MTLSDAVTADMLQALTRALDSDPSAGGKALFYSAPIPLSGAPVGSAVLLVTATFPKPSLGSLAGRTLTLATPVPSLAQASGTVAWVRFVNGAGIFVGDEDSVGLPASAARIKIDNGLGTLVMQTGGSLTSTMGTWALP